MTAPGTALKDFMIALRASLDTALDVPVYRGRPVGNQPNRAFAVVGAEALDGETNAGWTETEWAGIGPHGRSEHLYVNCLIAYRAASETAAQDGALDLLNAAASAVAADATLGMTYNALVARISATRIIPTGHGPVCALAFVVQAEAQLVG